MLVSKRQLRLLLIALFLSALMFAIVPIVTNAFSPLIGYVAVLVIYWVCFCIPTAVVFGRGPAYVSIGLRAAEPWIIVLALAVPTGVFFLANPARSFPWEPDILAIAVACALINGPLEELAWRRSFRANSNNSLPYELFGLGLFTLWHVPLYFSKGISFDHGAVGLVGGALFLGALWTFMTRAGNSVGWPALSHALVNMATFPPFFAANFTR